MADHRGEIKKLSFENVREIIITGQLHLLGRSESQQRVYDQFYDKILGEWDSVGDYILVEKLGIPLEIESSETKSRKKKAARPFPTNMKNVVKCIPNDFPYYFDDDVKHFILWKVDSEVNENDISNSIADLKKEFYSIDSAFYINPPHLKSIPEVSHAHIVLRVKRKLSIGTKLLITATGGIVTAFIYFQLAHSYSIFTDLKRLHKNISILNVFRFMYKYFLPFPIRAILNPFLHLWKFKIDIQ